MKSRSLSSGADFAAPFAEFHRKLVRSFGRLDYHLHEFRSSLEYDNAVVIGCAHDDYWDGPPIDEELVQIQQVFSHTKIVLLDL